MNFVGDNKLVLHSLGAVSYGTPYIGEPALLNNDTP